MFSRISLHEPHVSWLKLDTRRVSVSSFCRRFSLYYLHCTVHQRLYTSIRLVALSYQGEAMLLVKLVFAVRILQGSIEYLEQLYIT